MKIEHVHSDLTEPALDRFVAQRTMIHVGVDFLSVGLCESFELLHGVRVLVSQMGDGVGDGVRFAHNRSFASSTPVAGSLGLIEAFVNERPK